MTHLVDLCVLSFSFLLLPVETRVFIIVSCFLVISAARVLLPWLRHLLTNDWTDMLKTKVLGCKFAEK